jgi:hypothetical protein
MKRTTLMIAAAAAIAGLAGTTQLTGPAAAQGGGTQIKDGFIEFYDCTGVNPYSGQENDCIADRTASQNGWTTLGDAISSGWMGNTANPRESGNGVLPSQSPGSQTFGPFISNAVSGGVLD